MTAITIRNIKKKFGVVEILKGIDIEVASGEFLVLVGPSGCGKSTLLNLIAGLETVSSGDIFIGDKQVNQVSPKDRDIAMVFQSYALYPNMNVRKNLSFGLETRKVSRKEIDRIVDEVAKMLQIEDLLDRKPKQLSGGQRQRVAMGRALSRNPAVFLFDEPLSNLDAKLRVEMRTEIKLLHQRIGTTMIYVTHDQIEAMTLADRIALMKDGVIQQLDTPQSIYENPVNLFVAGFIGSPSMNFIICPVVDYQGSPTLKVQNDLGDHHHLKFRSWESKLAGRVGQNIILGLRPEHISDDLPTRNGNTHLLRFESTIKVAEPTGPDTLVYISLNGKDVTCRTHPGQARLPGKPISLVMDLAKAILFDPDTQNQLR